MITVFMASGFALLCGWIFAEAMSSGVRKPIGWYAVLMVAIFLIVVAFIFWLVQAP